MVAERQDGMAPPKADDWPVVESSKEPKRDKRGGENLPWLLGGVVFAALLLVLLVHFRQETNPAQQLAAKADRVDAISRMQLGLAAASEAEKSAVLAITDEDSQTFANQSRTVTADVERDLRDFGMSFTAGGTQHEKELLTRFSESFQNLKAIDEQVLTLAVKNTNLKAYSLLFGEATKTLEEMDAALSRVIAKYADSTEAKRVMTMAFDARIGVLKIQTQLAPHIAEESDDKMDQMEVPMRKEETQIRMDLASLASTAKLKGDADLVAASLQFAHYEEIKTRILALSRENTNVHSLALSLTQKRNALALSLDALNALKVAILDEPIAGITYGRPPKPR